MDLDEAPSSERLAYSYREAATAAGASVSDVRELVVEYLLADGLSDAVSERLDGQGDAAIFERYWLANSLHELVAAIDHRSVVGEYRPAPTQPLISA
jgi:hypothetical protein